MAPMKSSLSQWKYICMNVVFWTIPVISGATESLEKLNKAYEVFIVSSAMEFPNCLEEKYYWLKEHFPLSWKQIVLCGSKEGFREIL